MVHSSIIYNFSVFNSDFEIDDIDVMGYCTDSRFEAHIFGIR